VRPVSFRSDALGVERRLYIYVPPDLARGERLPALYLLRGHEREWVNPAEDASRGGQTVIDVYERLRAQRRIRRLILVFPGTSSYDNRIPSLLTNMCAPHLAHESPGIGAGQFADHFFDELIPYVDLHFPTIGEGRRRGAVGFSLGGAMAVSVAARRPDLFACAGSYDGTFLYATDHGRGLRQHDSVLRNPLFDPAFGVPRDLDAVMAVNPANLLLRRPLAELRSVAWAIGYGPQNQEPWQANFYRGEHLIKCMASRNIPNLLREPALPDGNHSWHTADRFIEQTLPLYEQVLYAA
jgi:S-formylglutathione hydrolase FrmB